MTPDLDLDAAIRTVIETIDADRLVGWLYIRAEGLQVNARSIWLYVDAPESREHPAWRLTQQRRAAQQYEAAREAFIHAYRFEKAMEVLRG